ncbi:MAG: DNA repair protein RecN [Gammaproteobacteria bacterium]|nr:MAG: DNA repair protein RecN [Gammaproteobacteria bacterium]
MLSQIHLQNFAISTAVEVEFDKGMSVLTGETGAGKSILVDALNLALGDRTDASMVRHGTDRAIINTTFVLEPDSPALTWLKEQSMDDGSECHLRRIITTEGRSRAYINDQPATLTALKTLGEMLVDIHGQHEHQSLMKTTRQRELLDNAGDHALLLQQVAEHASQIRSIRQELDKLRNTLTENQAMQELLRYQIQELETLNITQLDIAASLQEHEKTLNAGALQELSKMITHALTEDEEYALADKISHLSSEMEPWLETSEEFSNTHEMLSQILILIDEASDNLKQFQDQLDINPEHQAELDDLVKMLHELARKHQVRMEELPAVYQEKITQLENIDHSETRIMEFTQRLEELEARYLVDATELSQKRKQTAQHLSQAVTKQMQELGMKGGLFEIQVEHQSGQTNYPADGMDSICFMVSANPGHPLQPLQKVASGGELSRISLAITVITTNTTETPTMIFDEVDSGIGGGIAEIIGQQLMTLGETRQVLCVTHLPQVASQAHHHFRIVKTSSKSHTESRVMPLDQDSRIQEIARMLGGVKITEKSIAHARELLGSRETARAS